MDWVWSIFSPLGDGNSSWSSQKGVSVGAKPSIGNTCTVIHLTPRVLQLFLATVLLVLVFTLVRFAPLVGYTATPGSFSGATAFRYNQALETGHETSQPVSEFSSFDAGVNPARGEILYTKLQVVMSEILGYNRYVGTLFDASIVESVSLTIAFLLMGWLWTCRIAASSDKMPGRRFRLPAVSVFAAGTPTIVLYLLGWNAAYGWYFILLVVFLWLRGKSVGKSRALAFAFAFALFAIYTTAAITLLTVTIFMGLFVRRSFQTFAITVIAYAIAYFGYIAQLVFGTVLDLPRAVLAVLGFESRSAGLSYLASSSIWFKLLNGIISGAIVVPLLFSLYRRKASTQSATEYQLPRACVASLLVFGIGAASAIGTLNGIFRTTDYMALFSLMMIPISYRDRTPAHRTFLTAALITAILLSTAVHITSPTVTAQYLTSQESLGVAWITSHRNSTVVVFTDFRLAGPLVAAGYLRVMGVSDADRPPSEVNRLLDDIYYSGNPCLINRALIELRTLMTNQQYELFMVSARMTETFPGIKGYGFNYQAAPLGFRSAYATNPSMDLLYDNGEVQLFGSTQLGISPC